MHATISKTYVCETVHRLVNHEGQCSGLHGHRYEVTVTVHGTTQQDTGMVVDFGGPEFAIVKAFCATIDHACLIWRNDPLLKPLMDDPQTRVIPMTNHPTAEEIAGLISVIAKQSFVGTLHVFGGSVTVYETATARATVQWLPDEPRGLE